MHFDHNRAEVIDVFNIDLDLIVLAGRSLAGQLIQRSHERRSAKYYQWCEVEPSIIWLLIMHDSHVFADAQRGFGAFAVFAQYTAGKKTAVDVDVGTDDLDQFAESRSPQAYHHTKLLDVSPLAFNVDHRSEDALKHTLPSSISR